MPTATNTTVDGAGALVAPNSPRGELWMRLASELARNAYRHENDNLDRLRYPQSVGSRVRDGLLRWFGVLGFFQTPHIDSEIFKHPGLNDTYELLEDETSKDLLIKILAYWVLGYRKVRLDLNNPNYWALRRSLDSYIEQRDTVDGIPMLGALHRFHVKGIRLHTHQLGVLNAFFLEQYRCPAAGIGIKPGDIVIDGGGCWGDTALEFAQKAEHVFCFECIPSNIRIIEENCKLNPALEPKITVVCKALASRSGDKLRFHDSGPGSRASDTGGVEVETQTIDDFVREHGIRRIDFIKMDIEGSEPQALAGARETLIQYRPALAISLYHDIEHFVSIPKWLNSLDLGYRFYLGHFTIHKEETVLFASA